MAWFFAALIPTLFVATVVLCAPTVFQEWDRDQSGAGTYQLFNITNLQDNGLISGGTQCVEADVAGNLIGTGAVCTPALDHKVLVDGSDTTPGYLFPKITTLTPIVTSVVALISPPPTTGMVEWYKADSLLLTNGASVSTWTDSSSGGNTATNSGSASPTYQTSIQNGLPGVLFNGSSQFLTDTLNQQGAVTVYTVFKTVTNPTSGNFESIASIHGNTGPVVSEFLLLNIGGYLPYTWRDDMNGAGAGVGLSNALNTSAHYLQFTYNGGTNTSTSSYTANLDGTTSTVAASGTLNRTTTDLSALGARVTSGGSGSGFWNGYMLERIVYSGVQSGSDQTATLTYLSQKWGFTAPSGNEAVQFAEQGAFVSGGTTTTPQNLGLLSNNGILKCTISSAACTAADATAADLAAAQTWPTATQVLVSSGTTTAPVGDTKFTYDTTAHSLTLAGTAPLIVGAGVTGSKTAWSDADSISGLAQGLLRPASGTNTGQFMGVSPRGTGFTSAYKSALVAFNTDFFADPVNYEFVQLFAAGANFQVLASASGTGVVRPIEFSDGAATGPNANQLYLDTAGQVDLASLAAGGMVKAVAVTPTTGPTSGKLAIAVAGTDYVTPGTAITCAQSEGPFTGDVTKSAGSCATTVANVACTALPAFTGAVGKPSGSCVTAINAVPCGALPGFTGQVLNGGGGTCATTLATNTVTYGQIQQETAQTLLGNWSGGTANVREVNVGIGLGFAGSGLFATQTAYLTYYIISQSYVTTGYLSTSTSTVLAASLKPEYLLGLTSTTVGISVDVTANTLTVAGCPTCYSEFCIARNGAGASICSGHIINGTTGTFVNATSPIAGLSTDSWGVYYDGTGSPTGGITATVVLTVAQ